MPDTHFLTWHWWSSVVFFASVHLRNCWTDLQYCMVCHYHLCFHKCCTRLMYEAIKRSGSTFHVIIFFNFWPECTLENICPAIISNLSSKGSIISGVCIFEISSFYWMQISGSVGFVANFPNSIFPRMPFPHSPLRRILLQKAQKVRWMSR